jgi:type IV pilus assembly protein PilC
MKYKYTGITRQKEEVSGSVEAEDEMEARARVRAMEIRVLIIEESRDAQSGGMDFSKLLKMQMGSPIKLKQLILFTRQFSSLVDSGVPIVQCLDILQLQEKPRSPLKKILTQIKEDIESGSGLAVALAKHPKVFGEFFIRVIEAGELSGTLDKALQQIGLQLDKLAKLKSKVIGALTYPLITLVVAVAVLIFLLVKVIPEVAKLYSQGNAKMPELTIFVMGLSDWFVANFAYVIGFFATVIFGGGALYQLEAFRQLFDPIVLKIPLFGGLVLKSAVAQMTRTMATLVQAGVPLLTVFEIVIKLVKNRAINNSLQTASAYVSEGKTIAQGLSANGIFPPMLIHMINIGEMTGRLDELLTKVAAIYEDEVDDAIGALTGLLQPAIIVIVGGMIAFLLVAMYMPIFQLADKISGN